MNNFYSELRKQVKLAIQLPDSYTDIDTHLDMIIKSSKMYIDMALDNEIDLSNDLYRFTIVQLSIFKYLNVDNEDIKTYPIYISSALNQLKYSNN